MSTEPDETDDAATTEDESATETAGETQETADTGEATEGSNAEPQKRRSRRMRLFGRRADVDEDVPEYGLRIATLEDLDRFGDAAYVHEEIVRSWLALQQFGEATLLVMWHHGDTPVGHVLVSWTGDWNDEVRKKLKDVPALTNLHVDDAHRGKGIAAQLITAAEKLVKGTGNGKVTMSVAKNSPSRAAYEKLGYEDSKLRNVVVYEFTDADGKRKRAKDKNIVLVKDL